MRAAPVGYHAAVEAPLAAQNIVEQAAVVAAVLAVVFIVSAHDSPCAAVDNGFFECREIDFVERAVRHGYIDVSAPFLLIVQGKMLYRCSHSVLLQLLYIGHHHFACEIWVFAHIFEVATVQGCAVYVHARADEYVFFAIAGFLAHVFAVDGRHFRIPRGSERCEGGESRDGVVGPLGISPVVPVDFGTHAVWAVAHPDFGYSEAWHAGAGEFALGVAHLHLLVKRHAGEGVFDAFFDGLGLVEICRKLSGGSAGGYGEHQG